MMSPESVPSAMPQNKECEENNDHDVWSGEEEDVIEEPNEAMTFNTSEEACLYYSNYAKKQGFAVAKRTSRKGEDGSVTDLTIECTRAGKPRAKTSNPVRPRPQSKIGCLARVTVVKQEDGRWKFNVIALEHNHELQTPTKTRFFKSNRVLNKCVQRQLMLNDRAGIRMYKTYEALQIEAGGRDKLPFLKKDCRNYLDKHRRLQLKEGDAEAMRRYFSKMKKDNDGFWYEMDLDDKCRVRNVFWADARSRAACKEFGDVVTFDTTYLVNKYNMPFAPFVSVNHHGQSILLGCGLISHEDTTSFEWLFNTWKECMWDCAPKAIITDQCMAMKNAIENVFPDTRHRWCIWHIMKKILEKFGGYNAYKKISFSMRSAVYDSLTTEDFESAWAGFIKKYDLESNTWLEGLYQEKERWVPAYVKDVFWAGMSSTQRSESMNHYFDAYINSKTTLKQFVEQYENALENKVENETQEDVNNVTTFIPLITNSELEEQIQVVYTHAKVREFQEQLLAKCDCRYSKKKEVDIVSEFEVIQAITFGEGEEEKRRKEVPFVVTFNAESNEARCTCRLFEYKGMVCTHQLLVWHQMGIKRIPDKYVLKRWCKNIKRAHTKVRICYNKSLSSDEARWYDIMTKSFHEVAVVVGGSQGKFNLVMTGVRELLGKVNEAPAMGESNGVSLGDEVATQGQDSFSMGDGLAPSERGILDPECVKRKGRPPAKRKIGIVEKATSKKKQTKKKQSSNEKEVDEIVINHHIGTQESVTNNLGHPSYMGHSIWPNVISQNMPPNMTQWGNIIPNMAQGGSMFSNVMAQGGSIFPNVPHFANMAQGGRIFPTGMPFHQFMHLPNVEGGSIFPNNIQVSMGQPSISTIQTQVKGSQQSFMDMMTEANDGEE